jgi:multidrug transporter EmrE-like cation transporter
MVILAALGAALGYSLASVLQQHTASAAPPDQALKVGLLWNLAHRPLWILSILADLSGFVLQFFALGHGSLVLVQPLMVSGLLFALPLGAAISYKRWLTGREWISSGVVVAGLGLFLVVANPAPGKPATSGLAWTMVTVGTAGPAVLLAAVSVGRDPARRAGLLAVASGLLYALTAAFTRTVAFFVTHAHHGFGHTLLRTLEAWQTYGLLAGGLLSMVLTQTAFQAGPLGWSLPALSGVDPVVSIVIGAFAFRESVASSPPAVAAEVLGGAMLLVGIVLLNRSQLVTPS